MWNNSKKLSKNSEAIKENNAIKKTINETFLK